MTLDLAALRLLSWQGPFDPCATCGQTVGHRCRTSSNAVTTPHAPRLAEAKGYDARQPEVDELQQGIDQRDQVITAANDSLRVITTERDGLKADLAAANLEITQQGEQVAALTKSLAVTTAERDVLQKRLDDATKPAPEPPAPTPAPVPAPTPTKRRTQFGACILSGSAASVPAKFGQGAAVRQFLGTMADVSIPSGSLMHVSTKALGTDAEIDAWLKAVAG